MNAVVRLARTDFDAVVMDLDGVVTDTASLHEMAWKRMFDGFLDNPSTEAGRGPPAVRE